MAEYLSGSPDNMDKFLRRPDSEQIKRGQSVVIEYGGKLDGGWLLDRYDTQAGEARVTKGGQEVRISPDDLHVNNRLNRTWEEWEEFFTKAGGIGGVNLSHEQLHSTDLVTAQEAWSVFSKGTMDLNRTRSIFESLLGRS